MPTREELHGRKLTYYDASEDLQPNCLYPLRYRLGSLAALCSEIYNGNGTELQLDGKAAVTVANVDRKFDAARRKAIAKFVADCKVGESDAQVI